MEHNHQHSHDHLSNINRAFIVGIILNSLFVIIEIIAGFAANSLALLTDAGHNLSDVASLALSLLAFKLAKLKTNEKYTYGYRKMTVLITLVNATILLIAIGSIGYEAILRFFNPEPLQSKSVVIVATIGIFINSITAFLFLQDKEKDLNIKGAYLHLVTDALVSLGVVITAVLIMFTNWFWLDSVISLAIMLVILMGTWTLFKESLHLSLDGVPYNVDFEQVKHSILQITGVKDIHHIHIWAISTTQNALTAHLVLTLNTPHTQEQSIKRTLRHELEHQNIQHVTVEIERENQHCDTKEC